MVEVIISGVAQGATYSLAALGLVLVFGVAGVPNLAHGEAVMIGGVLAGVAAAHDVPFAAAIVVGAGAACLLGIIVGGVFDRLRNAPDDGKIIASLALIFIIEASTTNFMGTDARSVRGGPEGSVRILGAPLPTSWLLILIVGVGLCLALAIAVRSTRWGRGMRAMSMNPTAAAVVGIPTRRYALLAFAIGSILAGIAGALLASAFPIDPTYGETVSFVAFTIIIFAGVGSIGGALLGGLLLGLVDAFGTAYLSSTYADSLQFAFLLVVLLFRPQGLFGLRVERD